MERVIGFEPTTVCSAITGRGLRTGCRLRIEQYVVVPEQEEGE
jgi:hypothetical protein